MKVSKPALRRKPAVHRLSEVAAAARVRRHAREHAWTVVWRQGSVLGPLLALDAQGKLLAKRCGSFGELATRLGLLGADEVAA